MKRVAISRGVRMHAQRVTTVALVASFVVAPLHVAYAQASATTTSASATSSVSQAVSTAAVDGALTSPDAQLTVSSGDAKLNDKKSTTPTLPGEMSAMSQGESGNTRWINSYADSIRMPGPSYVSGAFTHDIPIVVPPGRAGIQPNLAISYDNQDKNYDSEFGYGWSLNIPYIERVQKNGINNLYSQNYYASSFDGELATTSATTYGAKFDDGSFRQYTFSTSTQTWTVVDKQGVQYIFGSSTASRVYDSSTSTTRIFRWMLDRVQDVNGNAMSYTYTTDQGRIYPAYIRYTANGTSTAPFEVSFVTETRPDIITSYKYGFPVVTGKRVREIDITFNSTLVNKYVFAYGSGFDQSRSLLQTVTQTAYSESGTPTTLPPTTLTYQAMDISWPQYSPAPTGLGDIVDSYGQDMGYRIFHTTANAGSDLVLSTDCSGVTRSGKEAPNMTDVTGSLNNLPALVACSDKSDLGVAFADANGDGYADLIKGKQGAYQEVWYYPFTAASTTLSNIPYIVDAAKKDRGVRFGDFNGDGYVDYLIGATSTNRLYLNNANGTGWTDAGTPNVTLAFIDATSSDSGARVIDVNGDSVDDVVKYKSGDSAPTVYLNRGDGLQWTATTTGITGIPVMVGTNGQDQGVRIIDVNGDGLSDFVVSTASAGSHFYINTGNGRTFTERSIAAIPYFLDANGYDIGTRIIDANSSNIPSFVTSNPSTKVLYMSSGKIPDMLTNVTLPTGGVISTTYQGTHIASINIPTVQTVTRNPNALGAVSSTTYSFMGGAYQTTYQNRKLAGFAQVDITDAAGNVTRTFYHQGNGDFGDIEASKGEYADIEGKMYRPYRIEQYSGTSTLMSVAVTKWDSKSLGNSRSLVFDARDTSQTWDGGASHRDTSITYDYATTTGNLIQKTTWGEVTSSNDGSFTDMGDDAYTTTVAYASSASSSVSALPSTETTVDYTSTKIKEARHYYDSLALGSISKGNETKTENWITGTTYASSTRSFNGYGMVTSTTDPRGNTTTSIYDSYVLYPATTTNALSQSTRYLYNYAFGKPKQTTDPHGLVFQTTFDGLGRPLEEKQPDLTTPSTLVTKATYAYSDAGVPQSVQKVSYLDGTRTHTDYTYRDGFGRTIQTRSQSATSTYSAKDTVYDARGLVLNESLPYASEGAAYTGSTPLIQDLSAYWKLDEATGNASDASGHGNTLLLSNNPSYTAARINNGINLQRASKQSLVIPDASQTGLDFAGDFSFSGWFILSSSSLSSVWYVPVSKYATAQGTGSYWLGISNGVDGGPSAHVNLIDASGNPHHGYLSTATWSPNTWYMMSFVYDHVSATMQVFRNGTSLGTISGMPTSLYNSAVPFSLGGGNLDATSHAIDQSVDGTLDEWGSWSRKLTAEEITQLYNGGAGTQLFPSSQSTPTELSTLRTSYAYDALKRPLTIATVVGTTTNAYTPWKVATTDPRNNVKEYLKDAYGNLVYVKEYNGGTYTTTYTYDGLSNLTGITDALGNVRSFTYDGLGRRLTAQDLHVSSDPTFGTYTYTYDAAGNLTQKVDPKSQTIQYTYDALNRIATENYTGASGTEVTYVYDSCTYGIGRLCTASSTQTAGGVRTAYTYNALGMKVGETLTRGSTTTAATTTYAYDRQGNTTIVTNPNGAQVTYAYNPASLISSVNRIQSGTTTPIATIPAYHPTSQIEQILFGSGASTTYTYDSNAMYRLTRIFSQGVATTTATSSLITDLAGYYKLDEVSGNAADSSGHNYTLTNINTIPYEAAKIANGANAGTANTTKRFETTNGLGAVYNASFSLGGWFKITTAPTTNQLYIMAYNRVNGATPTTQSRDWSLRYEDQSGTKKLSFVFSGYGAQNILAVTQTLTPGEWYHITGVYDATDSSMKLYLNGSPIGNTTRTASFGGGYGNGTGLFANYGGGYYTSAVIDEMGIWTRALTSSEVTTLYNGGSGLAHPFTTPGGSLVLQDLNYTYDAGGNILTRTDNSTLVGGEMVTYTYDALNRLVSASTSGTQFRPYAYTFGYDAIGNLTSGPAGTYSYTGTGNANPHAVTQTELTVGASTPTISYDASTLAGNGVNASSLTFAHTTNTSTTTGLIIVAVQKAPPTGACTTDTITGVTYNGAALTDLGYSIHNTAAPGTALKTYYGYAPAQGTHNVVVSASASCIRYVVATTYSGVKQSGFPDASGMGNPRNDTTVDGWQYPFTTHGGNLSSSVAAYYPLDESTGNAADTSGNTRTLTNINTVSYATGIINNGATVGTTNTTKRLTTDSSLGVTYDAPFSLSGWFKITTAPTTNQLYIMAYNRVNGTNPATQSRDWSLRYEDQSSTKKLSFVFSGNGAQNILVTTRTLTPGEWYHIAGVYDATDSSMKLYVNGTLVTSMTRTASFGGNYGNGTGLFANYGGGYYTSAAIEEMGFWARALTANEVATLAARTAPTEVSTVTTTVANGAWPVMIGVPSTAGTATAGEGTTIRQQQSGNLYYADANGPITPAGSATLSWHMPTSTHWITNHFSLPPVYANPGTTYTTSYTYDSNGNLTQTTVGATTTTYTYDYANRLISTQVNSGPVTSYTYDHSGARVTQTSGNTTTMYPTRYYSITQTLTGTTTYATSTEYVFAGDRVIATIDQPMVNGTSTGTSMLRFVHVDHLGSTNVVSSATGTIAQWFDYAPYGSILGSSGSGMKRQYIGQYTDDSGLSYLNARYLNSAQGQFLSQDPVFWEMGLTSDGKVALLNPQLQNSYSYANNNPITNKDPLGRFLELSGSLVVPGRAWSAGIRVDSNGVDYFLSGGAGFGLSAGFEAMWAPGVNLSHTNQAAITVNGTVADGVGGRVSQNILTYDPLTRKLISNGDPVLGLVFGAGAGGSIQAEGSAPIPRLVWNKPIAPSKLGSTANIPATISSGSNGYIGYSQTSQYAVQNNTTYVRTSGGGFAPSSLPSTVKDSQGTTYYRNSSGLLSTKPGL